MARTLVLDEQYERECFLLFVLDPYGGAGRRTAVILKLEGVLKSQHIYLRLCPDLQIAGESNQSRKEVSSGRRDCVYPPPLLFQLPKQL